MEEIKDIIAVIIMASVVFVFGFSAGEALMYAPMQLLHASILVGLILGVTWSAFRCGGISARD